LENEVSYLSSRLICRCIRGATRGIETFVIFTTLQDVIYSFLKRIKMKNGAKDLWAAKNNFKCGITATNLFPPFIKMRRVSLIQ